MRCFLAVKLPDHALQAVQQVQRSIESGAPGFYRWTPEEQLHITLYFLGDMEDAPLAELEEAIQAIQAEPFEIALDNLVALPEPNVPKILAAGIAGDVQSLVRFQQRVSDTVFQIATFKETRRYFPHVTLGRLKRGAPGYAKAVKRTLAATRLERTGPFKVEEFELVESKLGSSGPTYETRRTVLLG